MSSGVKDLFQKRNDPEYLNWLAASDALILLGDGLRKYVEVKMQELHTKIMKDVETIGGPGVKCHCPPGKKPNPHGQTATCAWAQVIKKYHVYKRKSDIPWHQSISSQWHDSVLGKWEISKLFMSDLGKECSKTKNFDTIDTGRLLNLLVFCNHFNIQPALSNAVRDWRNKLAHLPDETISDSDKQTVFDDIKRLMNDPELVNSQHVQECLPAVEQVEKADFVILQPHELRIYEEYRRIKEYQGSQREEKLKDELREVKEEIKVLKKRENLIKVVGKIGERNLTTSDDGCPAAMIKSPINHFHFQEFDFSSYLAYKREGFVGRKWFFSELETIFEERCETTGVLITGEPGSGKSALMSQLICSRSSSLLIHDNIIGYHFCEYSESGKRDGARFVRNLVDQIAARLPAYSELVMKNEQLRIELDMRCHKDITGCFFSTIVGPLRKLRQFDGLRYIIIDALDECFEGADMKTSEIMEILNSKIQHFPKWLKVILTSRNSTVVTSSLPYMRINRTSLHATDERNVNDIRLYVSRFISRNSDFADRLYTALNMEAKTGDIGRLLEEVITRAEGNFLFVKMTMHHMNDTSGKLLPAGLFDLYYIFFTRQFGRDGFKRFRSLFEVLLASFSPLQSRDIQEILKVEYEAENIPKVIEQVSCFLRFGRDGTVRIYHQSFTDWLIHQTPVLLINSTKGHQNIAKFLLNRMYKRQVNATFPALTELFMHILLGEALEVQQVAMNLYNITEMHDPITNQSILHYLVPKPRIYSPVFEFFSQKFETVDILDANNKTPAFYAASEGNIKALQSCISNGADISSFSEGYTELDPLLVIVRNTGIEEFSLMHTAVAKGHTEVIKVLMDNNLQLPDSSKSFPAPHHLAAGNGLLEVVKLFHEEGETFDSITLHHAAARNRLEIVKFLLSTVGLRDTCVSCQFERFSQLSLNKNVQATHSYFCETALHAAVSRGLIDIAKVLLSFGKDSLECRHHSGKTVLMDAVERNDTDMVDLLLENGANVDTECGKTSAKDAKLQLCSMHSKYKQDFMYTVYCLTESCKCGDRSIHLSAKYGLWKIAEKLTRGRTDDFLSLKNCWEDAAAHIAIMYDHAHFVQNINNSLKEVDRYLVRSKVLSAAALKYCSANVVKLVLANPGNDTITDERIRTLLMLSVSWSPCYKLSEIQSFGYCFQTLPDGGRSEEVKIRKESKNRLEIVKLLVDAHSDKSMVLSKKLENGRTLLHFAAVFGFEDAVKYLVKLGSNTLLKDENGDTPLMLALRELTNDHSNLNGMGRCYTAHDGQLYMCNTTCYDETVRYLIMSQRSNISKCDNESAFLLEQVIVKRLPLSLYALLKVGVDLNCNHMKFSSALLLHLKIGGMEITEVLKMFEVDVSLKCGLPFAMSELHLMSYLGESDGYGNFFKPSVNGKRFPLQRLIDRHPKGVRILDECFDDEGYLPVHRAALGGNLAAIKWFTSIGVNTQLKHLSGLTPLDVSIWSLRYNRKTNAKDQLESIKKLFSAFYDLSYKNYSSDICAVAFSKHPILHLATQMELDVLIAVYKTALEIIPNLRKNKMLILDEQDVNGDTPLHHAAYFGSGDVVKYLVRLGADANIKNNFGQTPLLIALIKSPVNSFEVNLDYSCYSAKDDFLKSCKTTPYDEIIRHVIFSTKTSISKCDAESAFMLTEIVSKRLPLSLYALLEIGVDLNCHQDEFNSALLIHLKTGGSAISEVLKMFEVDVSLKCALPFSMSELHLMSYLGESGSFGNFFRQSVNRKRFPLQRLIDPHPKGVRALDECFDEEGYLPIHRAAQGGNIDAIKWFISIGVNTQLKTRSGLNALDISILYLGELIAPAPLHQYLLKNLVSHPKSKRREELFEKLFRHFSTKPEFSQKFACGSSLKGLSPLHIAAVKGISVLRYVHRQMSKVLPKLPINCLNQHRLDPLYMAQFYTSVLSEGLVEEYPWKDIIKKPKYKTGPSKISKNQFNSGSSIPKTQYPNREVEYIMAFNYLYRPQLASIITKSLHDDHETEKSVFEHYFHYAEDLLSALDKRVSDCPHYYSNSLRFDKVAPVEDEDVFRRACSLALNILRMRLKGRRGNRRISYFIAKRMGWIGASQVTNVDNRFPFFFLHKTFLKKYEAYGYLEVLNEALEIADVRFYIGEKIQYHIIT